MALPLILSELGSVGLSGRPQFVGGFSRFRNVRPEKRLDIVNDCIQFAADLASCSNL